MSMVDEVDDAEAHPLEGTSQMRDVPIELIKAIFHVDCGLPMNVQRTPLRDPMHVTSKSGRQLWRRSARYLSLLPGQRTIRILLN